MDRRADRPDDLDPRGGAIPDPVTAAEASIHPREALAQWLRAGRAQRKLTIEDVARITKIQTRTLERLESGKPDGLPADVFVRGFVRSFAKCVGLDEDEALRRYGACGTPSPAPVVTAAARAVVEAMAELAPAAARAMPAGTRPPLASGSLQNLPRAQTVPPEAEVPVMAAVAAPAPVAAAPVAVAPAPAPVAAAPVAAAPVAAAPVVVPAAVAAAPAPVGAAPVVAAVAATPAPVGAAPVVAPAAIAAAPGPVAAAPAPGVAAPVTAAPVAMAPALVAPAAVAAAPVAETPRPVYEERPAPSVAERADAADTAAAAEPAAEPAADAKPSKKRGRRGGKGRNKRKALANGTPAEASPIVVETAEAAPVATETATASTITVEPELAATIAEPPPVIARSSETFATAVDPTDAVSEPAFEEPIATATWRPKMPAPAPALPPWRRPRATTSASPAASMSIPSLVIDDADPESAEQVLEEREAAKSVMTSAQRRSFLPPILLDREDRSARQGGLTLAVIILLIAATLTLSYLMRRPSSSGDGVTGRAAPVQPIG